MSDVEIRIRGRGAKLQVLGDNLTIPELCAALLVRHGTTTLTAAEIHAARAAVLVCETGDVDGVHTFALTAVLKGLQRMELADDTETIVLMRDGAEVSRIAVAPRR